MKKLSENRKGRLALTYIGKLINEIYLKEFQAKLYREAPQIAKAINEDPQQLISFGKSVWFLTFDHDDPELQRIAIKLVKYHIKNHKNYNPLAESNRKIFGNIVKRMNVNLDEAMAFVREILHEVVEEVYYVSKAS